MAEKAVASSGRGLVGSFLRYAGIRACIGLMLALAGSLIEAIGLIWLAAVLRVIQEPDAASAFPSLARVLLDMAGSSDRRLALALASFGLIVLVRAAVLAMRDAFLARLQFGYVEHVKTELLTAIGAAPYRTISGISQGHVSLAITGDIHDLGVAANNMLLCCVSAVTLLASGGLAFLLSPALAVTALLASAILVGALPLARRAARLGLRLRQRRRAVAEQMLQLLAGLKPAKAQAIDLRLIDRLKTASASVVETQLAFLRLQSGTRNLWSVLTAMIGISAAAAGLLLWRIDPTVVIAFILLTARATGPAIALHQGIQQVFQCGGAFESLAKIRARLTAAEAARHAEPTPPILTGASGLTLLGASYLHRDAEGVDGVTTHIPHGCFWGIAGLSGAGKTTFIDLVTGLLEPQSGAVLLDGRPLRGATLDRHRQSLAYVRQDAVLFGETLRDGFALGAPAIDDALIREKLQLVGADDLLHRVPELLDLPLLTRDAFVSSGERQRLAIAAALLRQPATLVLDEATNALDMPAEAQLLSALAALRPRPTILLIAHRPHALALCEQVLHFRQGRLVGAETALPFEADGHAA